MSDVLGKLPRILCPDCPAVVTVHSAEFEAMRDAVLVWMECHGKQRMAIFDAETLRYAGTRPLLWDDAIDIDVAERISEWERRLLECEEKLAAYRRFVGEVKP